jgi:hypothetical protein
MLLGTRQAYDERYKFLVYWILIKMLRADSSSHAASGEIL